MYCSTGHEDLHMSTLNLLRWNICGEAGGEEAEEEEEDREEKVRGKQRETERGGRTGGGKRKRADQSVRALCSLSWQLSAALRGMCVCARARPCSWQTQTTH